MAVVKSRSGRSDSMDFTRLVIYTVAMLMENFWDIRSSSDVSHDASDDATRRETQWEKHVSVPINRNVSRRSR